MTANLPRHRRQNTPYMGYGLILPKKNQLSAPKAGNVFGNDDDSEEEEEGTDWVKKALKAENEKNKIKKQTKLNMQKALKEDPTIFLYDEVYDEIERTKEEANAVKKVENKPKYINNLLKTAELRKKEQELRKDRIIQKEIEAEDAMFPDKERFITSSYKTKLEEMKKFEEEQDNQDRLEAIGDVTKQKDMTGFYRHLYRQTVEKNDADLGIVPQTEKSSEKKEDVNELPADIDKDDPIPSDSDSEDSNKSSNKQAETIARNAVAKVKNQRQYRKRAQQVSESESEEEISKNEDKLADKENSEKSNDEEASKTPSKKQKLMDKDENKVSEASDSQLEESAVQSLEKLEKNTDLSTKIIENEKSVEKNLKKEKKVKVNIWEKRTVGDKFDQALMRYLERKQQRLAGS